MSDLASIITAIAALITSITILIATLVNAHRIKDVHTEVKTANSLTMAQLADAEETRRIDDIPAKDRTDLENTHISEVDSPPQKDS